jgi:thiol-disulfide isomerase/thioredoxin
MNRLLIACCLAASLVACKPTNDGAKTSAATAPAAPAPASSTSSSVSSSSSSSSSAPRPDHPMLKVTMLDGAHYDLAAHRGKWVVVNFWATWCGPCLKEMPELSALDAMREHIEVVGLAYEDITPADMKAFLVKHPVVYPIAILDVYAPPADFDTPRGLPTTYLIAPDGKIAKQFLGPVTAKDIESAIAAAGGPRAA